MKKYLPLVACFALALAFAAVQQTVPAFAQAWCAGNVAPWPGGVWDPQTCYYLKPNSDGSINVSAIAAQSPAQGSTTAGQTGPLVQTATTTAAPTYVTGTTNPASSDVKGALRVLNMDSVGAPIDFTAVVTTALQEKQTYSTAIAGLAPAVAATDLVCVTGSATKTVRVTRFQISGVATAAGAYTVLIAKRSTADSAGTAMTEVPLDSTNSAATAVGESYTTVPTPGTLVGNVASRRITVSTAAGAIPIVVNELEFGSNGRQGIVLRGITEQACINLNATTMTGGLLDITAQWTEE